MDAMVTGGAGFIGSHLVQSLAARGDRVVVCDDLSTSTAENRACVERAGAELVVLDIRDSEAIAELLDSSACEVVFHLAAQMDVRRSVAAPGFDAAVNVVGTVNLLEAARRTGARFVFASTGGAIYGEGEGRELPFQEGAELRPDSPYGQSKLAGEGYCDLFARLYGLRTVALRLGNVYGPRQNPLGEAGVIAMFAGRLDRGEELTVFGTGGQTRDYVYVDDVVEALLTAGDLPELDGVFNVGTGIATSVLHLAEELARAFGLDEPPIRFAPARFGEVQDTSLDPGAAEAELGWKAAVDLPSGLRHTVSWVTASGEQGAAARPVG